ncbi:hypothetical protein BJY52DRAFT_1187249 [Lactarius psammicola]|nr:hypothetical protein BJY52DRAFT_1187249 [Lactarius psammicola]
MSFQQDTQSGSFHNDNTVTAFRLISAITAVTVATSSVLLWRVRRLSPAEATRDPKPFAPAPSSLRTTLASLYPSGFLIPSRTGAASEPISEEIPHDVVQLQPEVQPEDPKGKASRSKERRRRGKDLFKGLSKSSKKRKELHRQFNRHPATSLGDPTALQAEPGHSHPEPSPVKSNGSSRGQISGPSQLREFTLNRFDAVTTPRLLIDKPPDDTISQSLAGTFNLLAVTANKETSVEDLLPSHNNEAVSSDRITASEELSASQDRSCKASTDHFAARSQGLGSHTKGFSSSSNTSLPSQGRPHSSITSGSCDWDGQSSFCQEPTPHFAAVRPTNSQSGLSSTPLTCPTPALRVGDRRAPTSHAPPSPSPDPVSAQTQIASLRGALEAARLREEKSRLEADCRAKEYDTLRRRWMEEIARRQRREAQLHAYIQYLTHVLQMYAGAYPSLSTRVPIVHPLVASPLPGVVPSITMHRPHNPVLDNTRGQRRKREVQDDEFVGNPDMDVLPLCNDVIGAILKRPESFGTDIQPKPQRFPSLLDMGHVWYVAGSETEELNGVAAEDGGENEAVREENGYLSGNPPSG